VSAPLLRASISLVAGLTAVALLAGCSSIQTGRIAPGQRLDPWENWNRKVFAFNEGLDEAVLKPVATIYSDVLPQGIRNGVGNFYGTCSMPGRRLTTCCRASSPKDSTMSPG
jgi:phospholipid-binding lipoprotein MlaA